MSLNKKFWVGLGAQPAMLGTTSHEVSGRLDFDAGPISGGTNGSVVNHVAFRVQSFATLEGAGFKVQRLAQFPGVGSVSTPEGERIELFENTATNLTFTLDSGERDPVADRHNRPLAVPIAFHHIHLYVPGSGRHGEGLGRQMFGSVPEEVELPGGPDFYNASTYFLNRR